MNKQTKSSKLPKKEKLALIAMLEYVRISVEYWDPLADGLIQMAIAQMEEIGEEQPAIKPRRPSRILH